MTLKPIFASLGRCREECIMKDFLLHNNKECFVKEPNNIFTFPPIWSDEFACGTGMFDCALYLVRDELTDKEILIKITCFPIDKLDGFDQVGFTIFNSQDSLKSHKIRILLTSEEKPDFKLEVLNVVNKRPYSYKEEESILNDQDVVLTVVKEKSFVKFEILP